MKTLVSPTLSPWQAIATVTEQVNQTAQQLLREKVEKDGAAIAATEWAAFLQGTHAHINQAVQWTDVGTDPHTGNLTCLVKPDPNHPDQGSLDTPSSTQPLSRYVFESLNKRGAQLLARAKNPVARKILESKLQGHGIQVAESLAREEARLIHDKRKVMVGDALENLAKAAYQTPSDVEGHLADIAGVVNRIADSPSERDKLLRLAREKIAEAAAMGTIHKNPHAFLGNPAWQQHLSLESFVRFTHTAKTLAHQAQAQLQHQVSSLFPSPL